MSDAHEYNVKKIAKAKMNRMRWQKVVLRTMEWGRRNCWIAPQMTDEQASPMFIQ